MIRAVTHIWVVDFVGHPASLKGHVDEWVRSDSGSETARDDFPSSESQRSRSRPRLQSPSTNLVHSRNTAEDSSAVPSNFGMI